MVSSSATIFYFFLRNQIRSKLCLDISSLLVGLLALALDCGGFFVYGDFAALVSTVAEEDDFDSEVIPVDTLAYLSISAPF